MELFKLVEQDDSKETFLTFVTALQADWEKGQLAWENPDLERFLEAMYAWTNDMGTRIPDVASWRTFADMLYAAKIYE
ncbi:MAG TPA: hypothetical protein PK530_05275 [Anaerolineales bacterium]|nr:hypothetical protein [Anaerolineales bacterium]